MKKNTSVRGLILISLMSLVPLIALAQTGGIEVTRGIGTFGSIIDTITQSIVRSLATLFATAAMAAFFYGIVQYIWGVRDGKPDKVAAGNKFMVSGLIALFVMFSVWGIITYAQNIFGIKGQNTIIIPNVKIGNDSTAAPSPLGTGGTGGSYTCPNGTPYYNQSDYKTACAGTTNVGATGETTQTVYYCPNGTPYYNQSDYKTACGNIGGTTQPTCPYADPSRCEAGAAN